MRPLPRWLPQARASAGMQQYTEHVRRDSVTVTALIRIYSFIFSQVVSQFFCSRPLLSRHRCFKRLSVLPMLQEIQRKDLTSAARTPYCVYFLPQAWASEPSRKRWIREIVLASSWKSVYYTFSVTRKLTIDIHCSMLELCFLVSASEESQNLSSIQGARIQMMSPANVKEATSANINSNLLVIIIFD